MQQWYAQALEETFRDTPHEEEMLRTGRVLEDFRAPGQLSSSPA
jgi:glutathione S-transferase